MEDLHNKILRCLPAASAYNPLEERLELTDVEWSALHRSFQQIDYEHPECELVKFLEQHSYSHRGLIIVNLKSERRSSDLSH